MTKYSTGKNRTLKLLVLSMILIVIITVFPSFFNASGETFLEVHFLDVGQGDSILIRTPGGQSILVDGGERSQGLAVTSYLQSLGIKSLDLVVATHPHSDHIGGLIHVLRHFPAEQIIASPGVHTSNTFFDFLSVIEEKNIPVSFPPTETVQEFEDELFLQFLSPRDHFSDHLNDLSVVFQLHYREHTFLFTGDLEAAGEAHLLQHYSSEVLNSQVLKVAHHGSRSSSGKDFLQAVQPKIAVISCGSGNSYGHPHEEVLKGLLSHAQGIFRTDLQGTVLIISNGVELWSPSEPAHTPVSIDSFVFPADFFALTGESR